MPQPNWFFFDRNKLVALAEKNAAAYRAAEPFPSIAIDQFLPTEIAECIRDEFPTPDFAGFRQPDNAFQKNKLGRAQDSFFEGLSPFIRHMLNEFNSLAFIDFLEALTGIKGLIPDPHFKGGALHQILSGGKLGIHADFNKDGYRQLERRVNVLLYFNDDWKEEYGGDLELWDRQMQKCVKRIAPILNRCVVFSTTSDSFHGHPDPLKLPKGKTRNSIALYYYTNGRDGEKPIEHSTLWRARPGVDEPSGEGGRIEGVVEKIGLKRKVYSFVKSWIPQGLRPQRFSTRSGRKK